LFSAVISEHFSKNCMIISVVAAKNGISQMCGFYLATLYMYTFVGVSHFDHARDGDHISRNTCVH